MVGDRAAARINLFDMTSIHGCVAPCARGAGSHARF
jgi:hypothetical protein